MLMMALELFKWWYSDGWLMWYRRMLSRTERILQIFSVPILVRTMFAPWRRIVSAPGGGLAGIFRAMVDNAVSRLVGGGVRLIVLITAGLAMILSLLLGILELIIWPLVPLGIILSLLRAFL